MRRSKEIISSGSASWAVAIGGVLFFVGAETQAQESEQGTLPHEILEELTKEFPSFSLDEVRNPYLSMAENCYPRDLDTLATGIYLFTTNDQGRQEVSDFFPLQFACAQGENQTDWNTSYAQFDWLLIQLFYLQKKPGLPFLPLYDPWITGNLADVVRTPDSGSLSMPLGLPVTDLTNPEQEHQPFDLTFSNKPGTGGFLERVEQLLLHSDRSISEFLPFPTTVVDHHRHQILVDELQATVLLYTVDPDLIVNPAQIPPFPLTELTQLIGEENVAQLSILSPDGTIKPEFWNNQPGEERITFILFDFDDQFALTKEQVAVLGACGTTFLIMMFLAMVLFKKQITAKFAAFSQKAFQESQNAVKQQEVKKRVQELQPRLTELADNFRLYRENPTKNHLLSRVILPILALEASVSALKKEFVKEAKNDQGLLEVIELLSNFSMGTVMNTSNPVHVLLSSASPAFSRQELRQFLDEVNSNQAADAETSHKLEKIIDQLYPKEVTPVIVSKEASQPLRYDVVFQDQLKQLNSIELATMIFEHSEIAFFARSRGKQLVAEIMKQLTTDTLTLDQLTTAFDTSSYLKVEKRGDYFVVTYLTSGQDKEVSFSKQQSQEKISISIK